MGFALCPRAWYKAAVGGTALWSLERSFPKEARRRMACPGLQESWMSVAQVR